MKSLTIHIEFEFDIQSLTLVLLKAALLTTRIAILLLSSGFERFSAASFALVGFRLDIWLRNYTYTWLWS
jgi:hypothetical protein